MLNERIDHNAEIPKTGISRKFFTHVKSNVSTEQ